MSYIDALNDLTDEHATSWQQCVSGQIAEDSSIVDRDFCKAYAAI